MSKQKSDLKNQQINFTGKLEQNATIFFMTEEKETTGLEFFSKFFDYCIKMESQKIINLLDHKGKDDPRFETKKWYIVNDHNNGSYGTGNDM